MCKVKPQDRGLLKVVGNVEPSVLLRWYFECERGLTLAPKKSKITEIKGYGSTFYFYGCLLMILRWGCVGFGEVKFIICD